MDCAAAAPMFLIFSISIVCCSSAMHHVHAKPLQSWRRGLIFIPADTTGTLPVPPSTPAAPSPPLTNPVTTPTPNLPGGPPLPDPTTPPTPPATNLPGMPPVTDPSTPPGPTGGLPGTTPAMAPPTAGNAPAGPGQSWCVAKNGVPETTIQVALDYACGMGGADCSAIQQGASCYNPNTLQNHASFAFNSYYQKNPGPTSCDFGGAASVTNVNPSTGSCVFPTSSSSPTGTTPMSPTPPTGTTPMPPTPSSADPTITSPAAMNPPPTNPTTTTPPPMGETPPSSTGPMPTGAGIMPNLMNASSPDMGGAPANTASDSSKSANVPPRLFTGCIVAGISIITGRMIMSV